MNTLTEFLFAAPASRRPGAIIAWWERRRLAYNAWVGAAGLVSLGTVGFLHALVEGRGFFPEGLFVAGAFGVMANVCYLLGPTAELLFEKVWGRGVLPTGPLLFRMGLTFSVGLALFPTLLAGPVIVVQVVRALLGLG